ncbi:hypothetical protein ACO0LG_08490 [Undibacterium sp. Ji42W]|uniref:hypothetical protein n=1 Tax=Undibacterium sp. Ji42W TaxID=3413039 RepID=UPI003BF1CA15
MTNQVEYSIDARKLAGVVNELNQVAAGKGFTRLELILGLAEYAGRCIVDSAETPIQAQQIAQVAFSHLSQTITAGMAANKSSIARLG